MLPINVLILKCASIFFGSGGLKTIFIVEKIFKFSTSASIFKKVNLVGTLG